MTIADKFISRVSPILSALLTAVRRAERFLGPEDDWVEDDRRIAYEAADAFLRPLGRPAVRKKGPTDYFLTAHANDDTVEAALHEAGYQRNLLSTRKYRSDHGGGRQWAAGSWVYDPPDTDWQHHVYLFDSPWDGTDIYGHREVSVRNPSEHVSGKQSHGDPDGRVQSTLDGHDISYGVRQI